MPIQSESTEHQSPFDTLHDTKASAKIISVGYSSLKMSRRNGLLLGVQPPDFVKMGKNVRYWQSTLLKWRSQFKEQSPTNTSSIMTAKLTNITRTHQGIEFRDVGSSIHQAFWDGYDNVKYRRNWVLLPVWKKGRSAAKKGLYRGVEICSQR